MNDPHHGTAAGLACLDTLCIDTLRTLAIGAGVETTTGPLGQGAATSVGMAIAQAWLAATCNRPGFDLFSHKVYALCGDGDMMEGISGEAASLAGLCWLYDANQISIEGSTAITFTEDVAARFSAYGWRVEHVADANDLDAVACGLQAFVQTVDRPTLVIVHSHIGYGAPHKQDTRDAHGEPLGAEEARLAKQFYGFDPNAQFAVPGGVPEHFGAQFGARGTQAHTAWKALFAAYRAVPRPCGTDRLYAAPRVASRMGRRTAALRGRRQAWRRARRRRRC